MYHHLVKLLCVDDKNNRDLIKKIKIKNFLTYGIKKTQICNKKR